MANIRTLQNNRLARSTRPAPGQALWRRALLVAGLLSSWSVAHAQAATATLPPRTVPVPLRDMLLPVPVSGDLAYTTRAGTAVVQARLVGDLSAAQRQSTDVLRALIDRNPGCGDRLAVRDGRLGARAPALRVTGTLDYERVACMAGRQMVLVPRSPVYVDVLLHPVVQPRSLRVRAEVLDVRSPEAAIPQAVQGRLKETLARLIDQRVGELFPSGLAPGDVALKSLAFEEVKPHRLVARLAGSGSLPQAALERLLRAPGSRP
jgi:hypothetical protein